MTYIDKKLSNYIDQLNKEKTPKEHRNSSHSEQFESLMGVVREVRSLREPAYPDEEFPKRLVASLQKGYGKRERRKRFMIRKKIWLGATAVAAAAAVFVLSWNVLPMNDNKNIVYAMEQAIEQIKAYHGVLEVAQMNELGESVIQARREVWSDQNGNYYVREIEGFAKGLITINNKDRKWQIRPEDKAVYIYSAFPDPYRFTFELGEEIKDIKNALEVKVIGDEMVSGRETTLLEVTPQGGETYHLWIDKETDLPLQKQSAMQNALQYKVSYTEIDFFDEIPANMLAYEVPKGYKEVNIDSEQAVSNLEEARDMVGFSPVLTKVPEGYQLSGIFVKLDKKAIKLHYRSMDRNVILLQSIAEEKLTPASDAMLGSIGGNTAEIRTSEGAYSIRWQEEGMEYNVLGNVPLEELYKYVESITDKKVELPEKGNEEDFQPQIKVDVDLTVEENEQKSVDAGHSPWKLDPAFVAQVFASLLLSPEGIEGDYPIAYEDISIIKNNGIQVIAEIKNEKTIAKYVYLERLIRQDETGIWTVVGYDPSDLQ